MANKKRVMLLTTTLRVGGCERMVYELAKGLSLRGVPVCVVALTDTGPVEDWLKAEGIPVYVLEMRSSFDWLVLFRLKKILRKEKITVLHSFLFHSNLVARIARFLFRVPVQISSVRTMEKGATWHLWVDRFTKWMTSFELTNSELVRTFMIQSTGSDPYKIETIHNGTELVISPGLERNKIRSELGLDKNAFVIGVVGSLTHVKNHAFFIEMAAKLSKQQNHLQFVIVGDGPLRSELESQIESLGLKEFVHLIGFREDARDIIGAFDLFVLTSRWEGFPNVLLEAMAQKVPILSSDVGGVREVIHDKVNGEVASQYDPGVFADRVLRMLKDPKSLRQYVEVNYKIVSSDYRLDAMIEKTNAVYDELL